MLHFCAKLTHQNIAAGKLLPWKNGLKIFIISLDKIVKLRIQRNYSK